MLPVKVIQQLGHILHPVYGDAGCHRGFIGIVRRQENLPDALFPCQQHHGQHTAYRPQTTVQGHLPQEAAVLWQGREPSGCLEDRHENGKVIDRAGLFGVCRRQVYHNSCNGECHAAGTQGGFDPLPAFPDSRIRQPNHLKHGLSPADIDFHLDCKGVHAEQTQTVDLCKHSQCSSW